MSLGDTRLELLIDLVFFERVLRRPYWMGRIIEHALGVGAVAKGGEHFYRRLDWIGRRRGAGRCQRCWRGLGQCGWLHCSRHYLGCGGCYCGRCHCLDGPYGSEHYGIANNDRAGATHNDTAVITRTADDCCIQPVNKNGL